MNAFLDPRSFPEQLALTHPRALEYVDLAMAATRRALATVPPPTRRSYGPDAQQVVDIYPPAVGEGRRRPAVIFLHGGGWTAGYPFWTGYMAPAAHGIGAVFLSGGYGLAPRRKFPDHLEDVLRLLAWVHAHADELGIDVERIVLAGHSAGGHLSALAAVRNDLYDRFGLPRTPFRAAFAVSGSMALYRDSEVSGSVADRIYNYVLREPGDDRAASPLYQLKQPPVPIHLLAAEKDSPRIRNTSLAMNRELEAMGVPTSYAELSGLDHYDTGLMLEDKDHPWWSEVKSALASRQNQPAPAVGG